MGVEHGAALSLFFFTSILVEATEVSDSVAIEHGLLLLLQEQRPLGAEDDLAVAAEAVAVDRGVGHGDLPLAAQGVLCVVVRTGELDDAGQVVLDLAVPIEEVPVGHGRDAERVNEPVLLGTLRGPAAWAAAMKMLAASSWWLPSSAMSPAPVRAQSRQRISSSSGGAW